MLAIRNTAMQMLCVHPRDLVLFPTSLVSTSRPWCGSRLSGLFCSSMHGSPEYRIPDAFHGRDSFKVSQSKSHLDNSIQFNSTFNCTRQFEPTSLNFNLESRQCHSRPSTGRSHFYSQRRSCLSLQALTLSAPKRALNKMKVQIGIVGNPERWTLNSELRSSLDSFPQLRSTVLSEKIFKISVVWSIEEAVIAFLMAWLYGSLIIDVCTDGGWQPEVDDFFTRKRKSRSFCYAKAPIGVESHLDVLDIIAPATTQSQVDHYIPGHCVRARVSKLTSSFECLNDLSRILL